jgi:hypothetical protein
MKTTLSPAKVHRLRRIVGWLAVLLLGFALATAALAVTRGTGIEAGFNGENQPRFTTIHPGDAHQALIGFDVPDEVSLERQRPVGRHPSGSWGAMR